MIYLDSAATSLLKPPSVARAASMAIRTMASPGRGGHSAAMSAADTVFACRAAAAALFHVPEPERVVFTMNATHALDIAIHSLVSPGDPVVISGYEHNSVTRPLYALGAQVRVAASPLFDPAAAVDAFRRALPGARAAVCTMVSNVFGYLLPVQEIAELCAAARVPLIVDASQAAGCVALDASALGAAFVAMPGHKGLLGPQGTGILLCFAQPEPLLYGGTGSQSMLQTMPEQLPDRLEAGTHNVPGIAGLLAGIRYVSAQGVDNIARRERRLSQNLSERLRREMRLEVFASPDASCQTAVLSVRCRDMDCETLAQALAHSGIAVRAGLHCAPVAHRTAGTLETGTVRLSLSPFTTDADIAHTARAFHDILRTGKSGFLY